MKSVCISLVSTLFLCSIALAQTNGRSGAYSASTVSGGINLRSVVGAPFSADVVSQSTQILADGTPVTRESHGKMFRDSAGRTRSETELESSAAGVGPKRFVTIVDPVQGTSIVLDVAAKTATIFHLPSAPAVTARKLNLATAAQTGRQGAGHLNVPGSEDLGAMMIEGFAVTGSRRTRATEAGDAKGTSPNIVTETWFSPDLKVELLVTTQDLQSVSRTTRLTRIMPGEPDPALFQAPADYTVGENSQLKRVMQ
ncbi:MAG TPA: hypothetical protein VGH51_08565 [Candidatus Angelobacter sp.]|jgi:hypothetical protein